jgi:nitrous oxide reductase accessory protein NosL
MKTAADRFAAVICILMLGFCLLSAACQDPDAGSGAGPTPAKKGLDADGRMQISETDRCPVCAMPVAEHERFSAAIVLADGTAYYFCSAGCMLRAWVNPAHYLNRERDALRRPIVRDYFTGDFIDGRRALWISGSDVIGPMGPALVAIQSEDDLAVFRRRHGVGTVFSLSALNAGTWETLTGKPAGG